MGLLAAASRGRGSRSAHGRSELAVDEMRRLLDAARADNDVVLVDLGVLRAGGQSAVGTALSDRIVLVAACGERKQTISASLELLDRLAPERFLLTLNRAPAPDPLLTPAAAADDGSGRSAGWLKNLLNT